MIVGTHSWTRLLLWSLTYTLPDALTVTPVGDSSCPFPGPLDPNVATNVPAAVNFCTRLLALSAT